MRNVVTEIVQSNSPNQVKVEAIVGLLRKADSKAIMELHAMLVAYHPAWSPEKTSDLWKLSVALQWCNEAECNRERTVIEREFEVWVEQEIMRLLEGISFEFEGDPRGYAVYFRTANNRSNSWRGENWWGIGRG